MATIADRLDGFQRRHRVVGFPLAVTYKFFDDQSNYLAATVTYYAFAAIVPLLLISSSVLGFLIQGNADLRKHVLTSAVSQFPIVGTQLSSQEGLQGSAVTVLVGAVISVYGILGLGQASQNAVFVAWAIPRNSRPNPFVSRLHSGALLVLAGFVVLVLAALSSLAANADSLGFYANAGIGWLVDGVTVVLTAAVFAVLMQVATPERQSFRRLLPGALVVAVLWRAVQLLGRVYVDHVLAKASDLTTAFAVPLGLLALIYIAANMAVIGVQVNVVLINRLWPRSLLTPFTDAVDLTDADRRAYSAYAMAQRYKGFETVQVSFAPSRPDAASPEGPAQDTPWPKDPAVPGPSSGG